MDGVFAGHDLSLLLCLYGGADEETHMQGLCGCLGLHVELAGRCGGSWCTGLLPSIRAAGRAKGWGRA